MLIYCSDLCRYLTNHLLDSIYISPICTIHGWLPLNSFRHLGPCPIVGLEVKYPTFKIFFLIFIELFISEQHVLFSADYICVTSVVFFSFMESGVYEPLRTLFLVNIYLLFCWKRLNRMV